MPKPLNSQTEKRQQESLAVRFSATDGESVLFVKSSSDVGVIRNGGRNGARFAPRSLLSFFKKLAIDPRASRFAFQEAEVSRADEEVTDFEDAQKREAARIADEFRKFPGARLIHLGGGHDHVYPLLLNFAEKKRVVVINLDAHADTRTDSEAHSGTPFRQFARDYKGDFHLFQLGLHVFANAPSTLSDLPRGKMRVLWRKDLQEEAQWEKFFSEIRSLVDSETVVIFSLDADALSGELVPGVSAVNGLGLKTAELFKAWRMYRSLPLPHAPILGIYELNPVYDTLSGMSMRFMANFLYVTFRD